MNLTRDEKGFACFCFIFIVLQILMGLAI